jgi:hypothetical protein
VYAPFAEKILHSFGTIGKPDQSTIVTLLRRKGITLKNGYAKEEKSTKRNWRKCTAVPAHTPNGDWQECSSNTHLLLAIEWIQFDKHS